MELTWRTVCLPRGCELQKRMRSLSTMQELTWGYDAPWKMPNVISYAASWQERWQAKLVLADGEWEDLAWDPRWCDGLHRHGKAASPPWTQRSHRLLDVLWPAPLDVLGKRWLLLSSSRTWESGTLYPQILVILPPNHISESAVSPHPHPAARPPGSLWPWLQ